MIPETASHDSLPVLNKIDLTTLDTNHADAAVVIVRSIAFPCTRNQLNFIMFLTKLSVAAAIFFVEPEGMHIFIFIKISACAARVYGAMAAR